jgi:NitT/TauT family transport system ATP-binding protein
MIVRLTGLCHSYSRDGTDPVLTDVDLEVEAGRTVSILGRNGSGKSTLLGLVAGLIEPSCGTVDSPALRGVRVPIVFQDFRAGLFPWLTALDNLALPLVLLGMAWPKARRTAQQAADEAGLAFELGRRPGNLSGGQAQMISLLRALLLDSPLILFDEPSSALDIFASIDLAVLTSRLLRSRGSSALFVSHSIDEAILVADEVVVLAGRPGGIRGRIPISLPYPRNHDVLEDPSFEGVRHQIVEVIRHANEEPT